MERGIRVLNRAAEVFAGMAARWLVKWARLPSRARAERQWWQPSAQGPAAADFIAPGGRSVAALATLPRHARRRPDCRTALHGRRGRRLLHWPGGRSAFDDAERAEAGYFFADAGLVQNIDHLGDVLVGVGSLFFQTRPAAGAGVDAAAEQVDSRWNPPFPLGSRCLMTYNDDQKSGQWRIADAMDSTRA